MKLAAATLALAAIAFAGPAFAAPAAAERPATAAALFKPVAARCDRDARLGSAAGRACRDRRAARAERRAHADRCPQDHQGDGGPYGPTITSNYEFQAALWDFQSGCKANLKEYR